MLDINCFVPVCNMPSFFITETGQYWEGKHHNLNWSEIIDKLVRLAAKYTDRYASDVVHDINNIALKLQNCESFSRLFGFRENGVDHTEYVCCKGNALELKEYRSVWRIDVVFDESNNKVEMKLYQVRYNQV